LATFIKLLETVSRSQNRCHTFLDCLNQSSMPFNLRYDTTIKDSKRYNRLSWRAFYNGAGE
jgi:hypothetical protein